jgi:hypothetical protein
MASTNDTASRNLASVRRSRSSQFLLLVAVAGIAGFAAHIYTKLTIPEVKEYAEPRNFGQPRYGTVADMESVSLLPC